MSSENEIGSMPSKALLRQEREATRALAEIRNGTDPGHGLATAGAQAARDRRIVEAQEAKKARDAARAELSQRDGESRNIFSRMFFSEQNRKNRGDDYNARADKAAAERVAFNAELKAAQDERNKADLERRREAGLVWDPVAPAGGIEVAAVFSSDFLWQATAKEIRDGAMHEPTLHGRDIVHLWWLLNAIAAGGGKATLPAGQGRIPPHWPSYDIEVSDGIMYRENSVIHLEKNGYIAVERGAALTITYGARTKALAASFRKRTAA